MRLFLLIIIAVLVLGGCVSRAAQPVPVPGAAAPERQYSITVSAPQAQAAVGNPIDVRGSISVTPLEQQLLYRIYDASDTLVGRGPVRVSGEMGQPGSFAAQLAYSTAVAGMGRIELIALDAADGSSLAVAAVEVSLTATATPAATASAIPAPTMAPGSGTPTLTQAIFIETPAPGTIVGSPVTLTGRTTQFPVQGRLNYRVVDAGGSQLGAGSFPISGAPGQSGVFTASLSFSLPLDGGPLRFELFDQNPITGAVVAAASTELAVAPPLQPSPTPQLAQAIIIESPAPGMIVGSPVVITGRALRYPFDGALAYRIVDLNGNQLGVGVINVVGTADQPAAFTASLDFATPPEGGQLRIELFDQSALTGELAATAAVNVLVAPSPPSAPSPVPSQAIAIETPPPGTTVGSPIVITGRTSLFPFEGDLSYRVIDAAGKRLGLGSFPVNGTPDQGSTFAASLNFDLPPGGGLIRVELFDQNATNGAIAASAFIDLLVEPQPPTPQPPTPSPVRGSPR